MWCIIEDGEPQESTGPCAPDERSNIRVILRFRVYFHAYKHPGSFSGAEEQLRKIVGVADGKDTVKLRRRRQQIRIIPSRNNTDLAAYLVV